MFSIGQSGVDILNIYFLLVVLSLFLFLLFAFVFISKKNQRKRKQPEVYVSLKDALKTTRKGLLERLKSAFSNLSSDFNKDLETFEEILYTSDMGPKTVQRLVRSLEQSPMNFEGLCHALQSEVLHIFRSVENQSMVEAVYGKRALQSRPEVWMIVGVNGVGKTTTLGKLAHKFAQKGRKVLIAAGDTFRAAAGEQLSVWAKRAGVEIFWPKNIKSPSAIAFDACQQARDFDILLMDTAGRLHTQDPLMEELKKVKRVMNKSLPQSPHEVLLVLDANSGQNAIQQAQKFNEALKVSGVALTKMDGTAKGGMAVSIAYDARLPIQWVGVGENVEHLSPFSPKDFVEALFSKEQGP